MRDAYRGEAASKAIHEDLSIALTHLMPLVNMAFFSLAGASLLLVSFLHIHRSQSFIILL
jgi:hypothetical protein